MISIPVSKNNRAAITTPTTARMINTPTATNTIKPNPGAKPSSAIVSCSSDRSGTD
ncbi:MAG: hypothetical protein WBH03_06535 [Cyclobacteriaceae bacterium]